MSIWGTRFYDKAWLIILFSITEATPFASVSISPSDKTPWPGVLFSNLTSRFSIPIPFVPENSTEWKRNFGC